MLRQSHCTAALAALALSLTIDSGTAGSFVQTNLSSDIPGLAANTDPNLKNPWGMSFTPTSPVWISNQVTGVATLHSGSGSQSALVVTTPASPTGTVFDGTASFPLPIGGPALFMFSTLGGQIAGWNGASSTTAQTVYFATDGAVYTGLASGTVGGNAFLYAADFRGGKIDVIDSSFGKLPGSFTDPNLPAGYSPYNVQNIGGKLYVEYAAIDPITHVASHVANQGAVDVFDTKGNLVQRLVTGTNLNSPWGITLAPASFGDFANALLVGNNGDGTIDAFDPITGAFLGKLRDKLGNLLVNPSLWALAFRPSATGFDPNALYFTAGINGEADGLFGEIQVEGTPLPAALPLFASGLSALGVLGWRRKRKGAAARAA
jgi:uncharacterized protein (TIGR03118 family)